MDTSNDLFDELESMFDDIELDDVIDVSKLSDEELLKLYVGQRASLLEQEQMLSPKTQQARDAHSLRNAAQIEMRKRGLA